MGFKVQVATSKRCLAGVIRKRGLGTNYGKKRYRYHVCNACRVPKRQLFSDTDYVLPLNASSGALDAKRD